MPSVPVAGERVYSVHMHHTQAAGGERTHDKRLFFRGSSRGGRVTVTQKASGPQRELSSSFKGDSAASAASV